MGSSTCDDLSDASCIEHMPGVSQLVVGLCTLNHAHYGPKVVGMLAWNITLVSLKVYQSAFRATTAHESLSSPRARVNNCKSVPHTKRTT